MKPRISLLVINLFLYTSIMCSDGVVQERDASDYVEVDLQKISTEVAQQHINDESIVRSISGTSPNSITYAATAFGGTNNFFLGASNITTDLTYALSRASLDRADDGTWSVDLNPLAPDTGVTINGTANMPSPLNFNGPVTQVALLDGTLPVVAAPIKVLKDQSGTAKADVVLVSDIIDGTIVSTDGTDVIKDGNGTALATAVGVFPLNQPAQQFAALTASDDTIFLAVPQGRTIIFAQPPFGAHYSGIVRMQPDANDNNKLRIVKLDGTNIGTDKAYEIYVQGGTQTPVAAFPAVPGAEYVPQSTGTFFATYDGDSAHNPQPQIGNQVDMYWDPVLERLYIGLTGATAGLAQPAAIQSLLVGRLDTSGTSTWGKLFVEPAIDLANSFDDPSGAGLLGVGSSASSDSIIGFNRSNATQLAVDAYKIRTMHTSTGKAYAIVNGDVRYTNSQDNQTLVYALPLATQDPNPNNNGLIADDLFQDSARTATTNVKRSDPATGTYAADEWATVGAGGDDYNFISGPATQPLTDLQVVGDTVYASVSGTRNPNRTNEAGIFSSTALFNENGAVRAWTPWQRLGGTQNMQPGFNSVAQFGFDENSQNVWYLNGTDNLTVRISQWGPGDTVSHPNGTLSSALTDLTDNGGVTNLVAFDGATVGFKPATTANPTHPYDYFSMMVATGNGRVAMIQSGQDNGDGIFRPIMNYTSAIVTPGTTVGSNPTVYIFSSATGSLPDLGQVIAAEVDRQPLGVSNVGGYLFVGGEKGLAVLRDNTTGQGWVTSPQGLLGLVNLNGAGDDTAYPGGNNYAWQQLTGANGETFTDVRKIVADGYGKYVYVMTRTKLIRISPNEDDMKSGTIANNNILTILDLTNGLVAGQTLEGAYLPVGTNNSDETNYSTTHRAFSLETGVDEFFDLMILASLNETEDNITTRVTSLALATTRGVILTNGFFNGVDGLATEDNIQNIFLKLPAQFSGGDLVLGHTVRFDFVSSLRGGQLNQPNNSENYFYAEGNLYVTAYDQNLTNISVYRFNATTGLLLALNEPYQDSDGNTTPYFYKIGDIAPAARRYLDPQGPADFIGTITDYGSLQNGFAAAIPMVPNITAYQQLAPPLSAEAVSVGRVFDGDIDLSTMTIDPASGAKYIFGEFGVLVNE